MTGQEAGRPDMLSLYKRAGMYKFQTISASCRKFRHGAFSVYGMILQICVFL